MNDLASRPPTEHFRKIAKTLLKRYAAGDQAAIARAAAVFADLSHGAGTFTLMRAQHVIAVEHGFESWAQLHAAPAGVQRDAIGRLRAATPSHARGWDHEPSELCFSGVPLDLAIAMLSGSYHWWVRAFQSLTRFGAKRGLHRPLAAPDSPTSDPVRAAYADAWWQIQRTQPGHRISERPEEKLNVSIADLSVYGRTLGEIAHHLVDEDRERNQAALHSLSELARARLSAMLAHDDVKSAVVFTSTGRSIWPPEETRRTEPSPLRSDVVDDPTGTSIVVQGFAAHISMPGRAAVEGRFRQTAAAWR